MTIIEKLQTVFYQDFGNGIVIGQDFSEWSQADLEQLYQEVFGEVFNGT